MTELLTVVLAAGKGTRMQSTLPKVLHEVGGKAMLQQVLDAAKDAGSKRNVVVVGFGGETVKTAIGTQAEFVVQTKQLGTGHAVAQAADLLKNIDGTVMVLCGDTPLLTGKLLKKLYDEHKKAGAKATVLTAIMPDANGYGRIIRTKAGAVEKIVEQKDAAPQELLVQEVNSGIYCFECKALFKALENLNCDNAQGEYYLTDVLEILNKAGEKVWAVTADDYEETLGINSRVQLAGAEKIIRHRKNIELMNQGITIMDPDSTFIDMDVQIGKDTIIYPFTWLEGKTVVGDHCEIGPNSRFTNAKIGSFVTAHFSYGHDCEIEDEVILGPYVHLRPQTKIMKKVKIGNFVEVKNSIVGEGTKLPHLSYIGDADIGSGVNMGCGTITVNYDGKKKFRTVVGNDAFVGCNSNLVAPVSVGDGAYVGAGSTITKDVPPAALAIARQRQRNIEGWSDKRS
jgi:bifunctional UDP-N-acetylglucosamine pyrophosphorylase/glucosamine-1-phosphate N-acetyltransferase